MKCGIALPKASVKKVKKSSSCGSKHRRSSKSSCSSHSSKSSCSNHSSDNCSHSGSESGSDHCSVSWSDNCNGGPVGVPGVAGKPEGARPLVAKRGRKVVDKLRIVAKRAAKETGKRALAKGAKRVLKRK